MAQNERPAATGPDEHWAATDRSQGIDHLLCGLELYLAGHLTDARDIRVDQIARIPGGASRETYRFRLQYEEPDQRRERRLILRLDPPDSLIDTDRRTEFAVCKAFFDTAVPVPEVLWLEEEPRHLGSPFFIAAELTGFESSPVLMQKPAFRDARRRMGERKWSILGEIARQDPAALGLDRVMTPVTASETRSRELGYWERVLDADEVVPQPIIRWAIRWLRDHPPPPAQKISVVHGDFRSGNFLYDAQGEIHGILDWEMAHLGDPLEDLGWSFNRVWCFGRDARRGGLLPREDAIRIWEDASGLFADPVALRWWELFNCVKGQAIWVSAARTWMDGKNRHPGLAFASWMPMNTQDRGALELLGEL